MSKYMKNKHRLTIDMPVEMYKEYKSLCHKHDTTMRRVIIEMIKQILESEQEEH